MIRAEEALSVLNMLAAAYPSQQLPDDTVQLYVRTMTTDPFTELSVLAAAAAEHVSNVDWWPTVHQLTDAYRAEGRRRIEARRQAEQQRALSAGVLPGVALDPGYAVEMVDVMRTALAVAGAAPHNHHRGAENCSTCMHRDELAERVATEAQRLAADRGLRPPQVTETYACPVCQDVGFFPVNGTDRYRPCARCNEPGYQRWLDGHLAPGHECGECSDLRRGR